MYQLFSSHKKNGPATQYSLNFSQKFTEITKTIKQTRLTALKSRSTWVSQHQKLTICIQLSASLSLLVTPISCDHSLPFPTIQSITQFYVLIIHIPVHNLFPSFPGRTSLFCLAPSTSKVIHLFTKLSSSFLKIPEYPVLILLT